MQTGTWLAAIMTLLLVIIDNQHFISRNAATATTITGTTFNTADKQSAIINDGQKAGTSRDYTEISAYNRLRHSARQRRRYKQMLQQQQQKQQLQRQRSDGTIMVNELFGSLRRKLNNKNINGAIRNKAKAHHRDLKSKRERNEPLCESDRNTVHMNTPTEEYDPPFFVEIRCRSIADYEQQEGRIPIRPQTCVHGMLRCVQTYKDQHFSRRRVGSHSWHPYTIPNVPNSCECMWPVDKYGHQEL